jgi:hypothetical protein
MLLEHKDPVEMLKAISDDYSRRLMDQISRYKGRDS